MQIELRFALDLPDDAHPRFTAQLSEAVRRMLVRRHVKIIRVSEHRVYPDPPTGNPRPIGTRRIPLGQTATMESLIAWGQEHGMSQATIARAIGISAPHFSKLKSGVDPITPRTLRLIIVWLRSLDPHPGDLIRRFALLRPRSPRTA